MIFQVSMQIRTGNGDRCSSVLRALEPDNYVLPQGISIDMHCENGMLVVSITASDTHILTLRNTVDDVLVHVNLALKSISMVSGDEGMKKAFKPSQKMSKAIG